MNAWNPVDDAMDDGYESFFDQAAETAEEDGVDALDVVEWGIEDGTLDQHLEWQGIEDA